MEVSDDLQRRLVELVESFQKDMVERNRLRAESVRQYDSYLEQERRRLDQSEEGNRLYERNMQLQEAGSQRQHELRLKEIGRQRLALVILGIAIGLALVEAAILAWFDKFRTQ
jgi:hypothetical protein